MFFLCFSRDPCVCTNYLYQRKSQGSQDLIQLWECFRTFLTTIRSTFLSVSMWFGWVTFFSLNQIAEKKTLKHNVVKQWGEVFVMIDLYSASRRQIFILLTLMERPIHTLSLNWANQRSKIKRTTSLNSSIQCLESEWGSSYSLTWNHIFYFCVTVYCFAALHVRYNDPYSRYVHVWEVVTVDHDGKAEGRSGNLSGVI